MNQDSQDRRTRARLARRHESVVYYMRQSGLIKIGTTTAIVNRFRVIGAQELMAVEPGDRRWETTRHRQFAHVHSHLEWFHWGDYLAIHVNTLRDQFFERHGETVDDWFAHRIELTGTRLARNRPVLQPLPWKIPVPKPVAVPRSLVPAALRPRPEPIFVRAPQAVTALGITDQVFAMWVRTGRIRPAERSSVGRPMYRLSDAFAVKRETDAMQAHAAIPPEGITGQ